MLTLLYTFRCDWQTAALPSECLNRVKCTWILDDFHDTDATNKLEN